MQGFSGIRRLNDIVGESTAKELVFTGRTIDAFEAKEIGLVNKITPAELLMQESTLLADTIASKSFSGVSKSKECFNLLKSGDIEIAIKKSSELFASCFLHPDQKEVRRSDPRWMDSDNPHNNGNSLQPIIRHADHRR